ncbi:putative selenium-binding protein [Helianthus annuus]|uniref:Selenium-binding protein n=1 Tax=Helianthus annuus TaxID=4232 RepID=A0A251UPL9_HELAN|nr:putative selenium-binding protein [Helianthus annuus]KAJ0576951.1 putative selenium-binding protein [Helianthus annuus]KAJ0584522.1 putative selenium-binding protein [Helianthus annuus]KAJ0628935.1 putative selenium-binding protein [Helianthus annuus]KAJ0747135.1 putative selenium-binding protein [Helianthus annuus]
MATEIVVQLQHASIGDSKVANHSCCKNGPGYATPLDAMAGPKESLIYVTCVYTGAEARISSSELVVEKGIKAG